MRKGYLLAFALLTAACGDPREEEGPTAAPTPEQAFYAKYPPRFVEGIASPVGPAPFGDAKAVAEKAIRYNQHPCPTLIGAVRNEADGSVTAKCSNGERYIVFKVEAIEEPMALRCSALKEHLDINLETCDVI